MKDGVHSKQTPRESPAVAWDGIPGGDIAVAWVGTAGDLHLVYGDLAGVGYAAS